MTHSVRRRKIFRNVFFSDYFIFILDLIMRWIENYRGLFNYLAKRRYSCCVGLWDSSVSFRACRARFGGPVARLREICYPWICGGLLRPARGFSGLNSIPYGTRDGVSVSRETCSTTISRDVAVNVRIGPANDMPKILRYVLVSTCCISTSDSFPKPINQPSSSGTVANGIWLGFSRIHIFRWRDIFQKILRHARQRSLVIARHVLA